jgi:cell division protein FtsW
VGLLLCFVPGVAYKANGACRWLGFGSIHVQPSEFAKIAVLAVLADYLERHRGRLHEPRVALCAAAIPLPVMALVLPEPDFGTTAIVAMLSGVMLFLAGLRVTHLAMAAGAAGAIGLPVLVLEQYRVQRLTSFLDPWAAEQGDGYHVIQSWIAMHSGGLFGQGLGNSLAKLHFLPEPWTDFIAAVVAEELGLVGILALLTLYAAFVWRGLRIALRARDAHGMYLAGSITAMIGLQAALNLGVVMGVLPPKGLVLPFISYGASALVAQLWAVGILLSIAAEADDKHPSLGWGGSAGRTKGPGRPIAHLPAPGVA